MKCGVGRNDLYWKELFAGEDCTAPWKQLLQPEHMWWYVYLHGRQTLRRVSTCNSQGLDRLVPGIYVAKSPSRLGVIWLLRAADRVYNIPFVVQNPR